MNELEKSLHTLFNHTNDMIKFAETKNGGLMGFNGFAFSFMIPLIKDLQGDPEYHNSIVVIYLLFFAFANMISFFVAMSSLTSFFITKEMEEKFKPQENLLLFGTIASKDPEEYLQGYLERYKTDDDNYEYELDLARQLVISSRIAVRKYKTFNLALNWTFAGLLTPPGLYIFNKYLNPTKKG